MRRYIVALGIVFLVVAAILMPRLRYSRERAFAAMQNCFYVAGSYECLRGVADSILVHEDPKPLMDSVAVSFTPGFCHVIGHVIGQEMFAKSNDLEGSLQKCSQACSSACTHGVVTQALKAVPGIGATPEELQNPNLELLKTEGPKFCIGRDECHAIGHVLFQMFDDLPKSLAWCDDIAKKEPWMCYRGVFMENNMSVVADNNGMEAKKFRDPNNLLSPCDSVGERYQRACYHFLQINQENTLQERHVIDLHEKQRLRLEACQKLPHGRGRDSCMEGFGYSFPIFGDLPVDEVRGICDAIAAQSERQACLFGYAHSLSDFARVKDAYSLCDAEREVTSQKACYQAIFDAVQVRQISQLSRACDNVSALICAPTLKDFITHPRQLVFNPDDSDNVE